MHLSLYYKTAKRGRFSGGVIIKKLEILSPASFIPQIEARIVGLEEALKTKISAVKKNPSALVRIVRQQNHLQFYKRSSTSDVQGTYMPRSQEKLARSFVQNDYDRKTIPAIEAEIKELKDFLKSYMDKCSDNVYTKLASTRRQVVTPLTLDDETYAANWLKAEYHHKKFAENAPQLFTDNNEQVRSKSEIIIANALKAVGVPYRYEFPLFMYRSETVNDDTDFCQLHPDFYCLNVRTREEYAWEHFGMMDDQDYAAHAAEKLQLYAENGFFPGKNLIITMETSAKPVSSKLLKSVIKTYLK